MNYTTFDNVEPYVYERYRPDYPDSVPASVMEFAGCEKVKTILDVGCGTGKSTISYSNYAEKVIGIDINESALAVAKLRNSRTNIEYKVASAYEIPLPNNSVDIVVCATTVHWLDVKRFLNECERVVSSTGTLALYSYKHPEVKLVNNNNLQHKLNKIAREFLSKANLCMGINDDYRQIIAQVKNPEKCKFQTFFELEDKTLNDLKGLILSVSTFQQEKVTNTCGVHDVEDWKFDEDDPRKPYIDNIEKLLGHNDISNNDIALSFKFKIFGVMTKRPFI